MIRVTYFLLQPFSQLPPLPVGLHIVHPLQFSDPLVPCNHHSPPPSTPIRHRLKTSRRLFLRRQVRKGIVRSKFHATTAPPTQPQRSSLCLEHRPRSPAAPPFALLYQTRQDWKRCTRLQAPLLHLHPSSVSHPFLMAAQRHRRPECLSRPRACLLERTEFRSAGRHRPLRLRR